MLTDQPAARPVIVALGDSITRGDGTTTDADQRYPDHLQARLLAAGTGRRRSGAERRHRREPAAQAARGAVDDRTGSTATCSASLTPLHALILAGTNDIALPAMLGEKRPTAGDIVDGLRALARRRDPARRAAGAWHYHALRGRLPGSVPGRGK